MLERAHLMPQRIGKIIAVALIAEMIGAGPLYAQTPDPVLDAWIALRKVLWPHHYGPQLEAIPVPPERPIKFKPAIRTSRPKAVSAPVVQPAPLQIERPKPAKAKLRKPKPQRVVRADNSGPDLPWPCWVVRMHAAGKTRAQLEAQGYAHGISLSAKQRRQAAACLRGTR